MRQRLERLLRSPRIGFIAVILAVVLNLPSLTTGWHMDDILHRAQFLETGPMMDSSNMTHRMFDFLSGDPGEILAYKDIGVLPWWTLDSLKIRFWRPLSSFTHVVDYALWPQSGVLMHLHSVLWLALLIALTSRLYRRWISVPAVAGLAAVLYALDDAHGIPVGFLANRNAIIATSFGVLSLIWLDRWRRESWQPGALLSPLAFAAALLSGESGIGIAPYILGFALFLEPRGGGARWLPILPHAVVGVVWLTSYKLAGFGTSGSGFYLDPAGQPVEWLSQFVLRAPLLLLGQWFLPPSSFAFLWTPGQTLGIALFGLAVLALIMFLLKPILEQDALARMFAFGMLLSVIPITAGYPHDRLLFFVGIGAMGLLAMLLVRLFDSSLASKSARVFGWSLVVVHVVIAPLMQVVMTTAMQGQEPLYAGPARSLPDDPKLETQRLVVLNPPSFFYGQYNLIVPRLDGRATPESMLLLAPGTSELLVERTSERSLRIEAKDGYLGGAFDNVFRAESRTMAAGYRVQLSNVSVDVLTVTDDGRPLQVEFGFEPSIDDDAFRWVRYESGRYVAFTPPGVGETLTIEAVPFNMLAPES